MTVVVGDREWLREECESSMLLDEGTPVIKFTGCPDCKGTGMLLRRPFALYNNGMVQCPQCRRCHKHYEENQCLPQDILERIKKGVPSV